MTINVMLGGDIEQNIEGYIFLSRIKKIHFFLCILKCI